jgi:hypothetical protein
MARTAARLDRAERSVRGESAGGRVEFVGHYFVEAEIGDEGEALGGIEINGMGVRFLLAGFIDAGAGVLDEGAGFFGEFALGIDRVGDDVAAGIIGDEDVLAGFIDDDVARVGPFRGNGVDFGELCGIGRIDFITGDGAGFFSAEIIEFVDGVEKLAVRMDGEEGGAFGFGG